MSCSSEVAVMADGSWSMGNWKVPEWGLTGSEIGVFVGYDDSCSSTPRGRSASLSAAASMYLEDRTPKTSLRSNLDPNSKPFSPRSSPSSQEKCFSSLGSPDGYSDMKMPPSFSNDSGCHLYDDKQSPDALKDFSRPQREVDIQALVDKKMRTGVEKFEEDERRHKMVPFRISSGSSSSNSSTLSRRNPDSKDDSVFFTNGSRNSDGNWANPKKVQKADSPLLPTPEDFPPYGPVSGRKEEELDSYGLRSLAKMIQQSADSRQGAMSSVVSQEELGFDRHFVDNYAPKHQYMGSAFDNRVLSLLADYHGVPSEYPNGNPRLEKLPEVDFQCAPSDLLFFLFYVAVEHEWQLRAAYELFKRGWRYHKRLQLWLGKLNQNDVVGERTTSFERGKYQFFNIKTWKRDVAEFTIFYDEMAGVDIPAQNQAPKKIRADVEFLTKAQQLSQNYQLQMSQRPKNPPGFDNVCQQQLEMNCRQQRSVPRPDLYPGCWPNF